MKRLYILISALFILLFSGLAAVYKVPPSQPQDTGPEARPITTAQEAIDYAKALWQSEYLLQDTEALSWYAQREDDRFYVTAGIGDSQLYLHLDGDGGVPYLYNGLAQFDDTPIMQGTLEPRQDEVTQFLLDFLDVFRPGASARISSFASQREEITSHGCTFDVLMGYNQDSETYTFFVVQVAPRMRVVSCTMDMVLDSPG